MRSGTTTMLGGYSRTRSLARIRRRVRKWTRRSFPMAKSWSGVFTLPDNQTATVAILGAKRR
jgi:hypothetical protein